MDKLTLFLIPMLILQCFLHWCSTDGHTYKLESFKRWNNMDKFLKAEWNDSKKAYELSFTGRRDEDNTNFIFKKEEKDQLRIQLDKNPDYFLAVEGSDLVVKKLQDTSEEKDNYNFYQERLSIPSTDEKDNYFVQVYESKTSVGRYIKSEVSGSVSLGGKDDCGCWILIKPASSGK